MAPTYPMPVLPGATSPRRTLLPVVIDDGLFKWAVIRVGDSALALDLREISDEGGALIPEARPGVTGAPAP